MIPVSAMIYRRKRIRSAALDPLLHASTFSGSPLACHVAHEVVRIVRDPTFIDRLQRLSQRVETGLRSALRDHPGVRDIRGRGLMWGVECISSELAGEIVIESARTGLLITFCLSKPSVLRFYPPAIATDDEIDRGRRTIG